MSRSVTKDYALAGIPITVSFDHIRGWSKRINPVTRTLDKRWIERQRVARNICSRLDQRQQYMAIRTKAQRDERVKAIRERIAQLEELIEQTNRMHDDAEFQLEQIQADLEFYLPLMERLWIEHQIEQKKKYGRSYPAREAKPVDPQKLALAEKLARATGISVADALKELK